MENRTTGLKVKWIVVLAVITVLFVLLMCKWLAIPSFLFDSRSISLWGIGGAVSMLSQFGEGEGALTFVAVIIYIELAVSLGLMALTIVSAVKNFKYGAKIKNAAFVNGIVLSGIVILIVIITNAIAKEASNGWISSLLKLTASPILTLIFSIGGLVVLKVIPDKLTIDLGSGKSQASAAGAAPAYTANRVKFCPRCGKQAAPNAVFCPNCGNKF